jgi:hypothetical protein
MPDPEYPFECEIAHWNGTTHTMVVDASHPSVAVDRCLGHFGYLSGVTLKLPPRHPYLLARAQRVFDGERGAFL